MLFGAALCRGVRHHSFFPKHARSLHPSRCTPSLTSPLLPTPPLPTHVNSTPLLQDSQLAKSPALKVLHQVLVDNEIDHALFAGVSPNPTVAQVRRGLGRGTRHAGALPPVGIPRCWLRCLSRHPH